MQLNFGGIDDNKQDTINRDNAILRQELLDKLIDDLEYRHEDDYYFYDCMDDLDIDFLIENALREYKDIIDISSLDIELLEWDFYNYDVKLNDFLDNMDCYNLEMLKYLEIIENDTTSRAYKFLKHVVNNNWELETSGLFGNFWTIVYTGNFSYELPNSLSDELQEVYIRFSDSIENLAKDSIIEYMQRENEYYYSLEYTLNYLDHLDNEELQELIDNIED